jgi:protein-S-isoprenylcysteine O-methyltransferase Ste14
MPGMDTIVLPWVIFTIFWGIGFFIEQMDERQKHSFIYNIISGVFKALLFSAFILVYLFFFYYSNIYFLGDILFNQSIISKSIGFLLAIIGMSIALWARTVLGMNWSRDPSLVKSSTLIISGPYNIIRHPIYAGVIVMFLGTAIYLGLLGGFIGLILGSLGAFSKSITEEKELIKQFPKDYPEYKKRVKAFIPFIY